MTFFVRSFFFFYFFLRGGGLFGFPSHQQSRWARIALSFLNTLAQKGQVLKHSSYRTTITPFTLIFVPRNQVGRIVTSASALSDTENIVWRRRRVSSSLAAAPNRLATLLVLRERRFCWRRSEVNTKKWNKWKSRSHLLRSSDPGGWVILRPHHWCPPDVSPASVYGVLQTFQKLKHRISRWVIKKLLLFSHSQNKRSLGRWSILE